MEKKFLLPAISMLLGLVLGILFLVSYGQSDWIKMQGTTLEIIYVVVVSGLISFSAFRCKNAGGPKSGSVVRAAVLLIFGLLSFWLISTFSALLFMPGILLCLWMMR